MNREEDKVKSKTLLTKVKVEKEVKIKEMRRLGEKARGKIRPLLLVLEEESMKWTVMKNVKNLKYTTVDWVRKVSVTKDLTVRERNVNKKLWEELKEKRSHGEEGWYIRNEKLVRSRRGQE